MIRFDPFDKLSDMHRRPHPDLVFDPKPLPDPLDDLRFAEELRRMLDVRVDPIPEPLPPLDPPRDVLPPSIDLRPMPGPVDMRPIQDMIDLQKKF